MQLKKWGVRNTVRILTERRKLQSSHICSSVMSYPSGTKFTVEVPSTQETDISNLKKIPLIIPEIQAIKLSKKIYSFLFFFLHTLQKS